MPHDNGLTPAKLLAQARRDCAEEIRRVLRVVGGAVSRAELVIILGDTYAEPVIDAAISDVRRWLRTPPPSQPFVILLNDCRCPQCGPLKWKC
jgi:hypothetical protein